MIELFIYLKCVSLWFLQSYNRLLLIPFLLDRNIRAGMAKEGSHRPDLKPFRVCDRVSHCLLNFLPHISLILTLV